MNLDAKAAEIRRTILETALAAGKGHIPPALSWVEIAVALWCGGMDLSTDRFMLSKTHGHLTLDAILDEFGLIPEYPMWPGWPAKCSGSLGQGLSIATGLALADKLNGKPGRTFVVLGDAEIHEGAVWEAAAFAAHHRLTNLVAIIDDNAQCCANYTRDVLDMAPIYKKFSSFMWDFVELDGHDIWALMHHMQPRIWASRPLCLIAKTIKGKGIPYMEGSPSWHHRIPRGEEIEQARKALA